MQKLFFVIIGLSVTVFAPDPNFGRSVQMLGTRLAGLSSLYQIGGPRSFQLALKLQF